MPGGLRRNRKTGIFSQHFGNMATEHGGYIEDFTQRGHILAGFGAKFTTAHLY
jgi:hypothetical protein